MEITVFYAYQINNESNACVYDCPPSTSDLLNSGEWEPGPIYIREVILYVEPDPDRDPIAVVV